MISKNSNHYLMTQINNLGEEIENLNKTKDQDFKETIKNKRL